MAAMTRHRLADLLVSALQNGEGVRPPTEEEFEAEVQAKCVELFLADQDDPPIYNNMPPIAGALNWSLGLELRATTPMAKFRRCGP